MCEQETFWSLVHNTAHWEFELLLMLLDNVLIGGVVLGILWPKIRKHWRHHQCPPEDQK